MAWAVPPGRQLPVEFVIYDHSYFRGHPQLPHETHEPENTPWYHGTEEPDLKHSSGALVKKD